MVQRRPRVDLADVARVAGVSRSTASRALREEGRVSADTVARVMATAAELGYIRDLRAAELRATTPTTLGLLVRGAERSFYGEVAAQVQMAADARELDLLIVNGGDNHNSQDHAVRTLIGHRVAGIMIASGRASLPVAEYAADFVPTVLLGLASEHPHIDSVSIDSASETDLAEMVAAAGHRRVAVTASEQAESTTLRLRTERYRQALLARGVTVTLVPGAGDDGPEFVAALRRALDDSASAIMAGDDATAVRVLELFDAWGVRCPDDVSVTGFDGVGVFASPLFGLTTVRQPVAQMARAATSIMAARLQGTNTPVEHAVYDGEFLAGRTLAAVVDGG